MLWLFGNNFSQFEPKLEDVIRVAQDILKFHFCPKLYRGSYQTSKIEIAITF